MYIIHFFILCDVTLPDAVLARRPRRRRPVQRGLPLHVRGGHGGAHLQEQGNLVGTADRGGPVKRSTLIAILRINIFKWNCHWSKAQNMSNLLRYEAVWEHSERAIAKKALKHEGIMTIIKMIYQNSWHQGSCPFCAQKWSRNFKGSRTSQSRETEYARAKIW